jgi:hypothetical protein
MCVELKGSSCAEKLGEHFAWNSSNTKEPKDTAAKRDLPGEITFSNNCSRLLLSDFLFIFSWRRQGREEIYIYLFFLIGPFSTFWWPCGEHGYLT